MFFAAVNTLSLFPIVKCFIFKDWIGQLNSNKIVSKVLVLPCATAEKNNRTSFYLENSLNVLIRVKKNSVTQLIRELKRHHGR